MINPGSRFRESIRVSSVADSIFISDLALLYAARIGPLNSVSLSLNRLRLLARGFVLRLFVSSSLMAPSHCAGGLHPSTAWQHLRPHELQRTSSNVQVGGTAGLGAGIMEPRI